MIKKLYVKSLQRLDLASALSMRLVQITGKSKNRVHPKHLIKTQIWFEKYLKKGDQVLDLGCGIGEVDIRISQKVKKIIAGDIDKKTLHIAVSNALKKRVRNIEFKHLDGNKKLPFPNKSFDKIICSDVLEHLNRREFALLEIKRVLKPNGLLLLVTDNPNTSWKRLQKSAGLFFYADHDHKYEYPKGEILKIITSKGFKVVSINTVTYDTPFKGLIDLVGGFSLYYYKKLKSWREQMVKRHPEETTGYRIIAQRV